MNYNAASVITSVYDSAINETYWDSALDRCTDFVGAKSSTLIIIQNDPDTLLQVQRGSAMIRNAGAEIMEYWNKNLFHYEKEAWAEIIASSKQTLVTDKDVWAQSDEELVSREDYAFLINQFGVLRRIGACLNDNKAWIDNIAFQFDKSMTVIPKTSMESMQLLLPHIAKSIELERVFSVLQSQYNAVLTVLDCVEIGICIALNDGTIIVKNNEAEQILASQDGMKLKKDRTIAIPKDPETESALSMGISQVASTAMGENHIPEKILSVKRPSQSHPYLIEISPLRDATAELETSLNGVLIMIIDPGKSQVIDTDRLAKTYGFTEAEAGVARYVVDGWTNRNIAEERGVGIDTVKSQIAGVMQKTQSKRRSDLIRLALKVKPPIRNS